MSNAEKVGAIDYDALLIGELDALALRLRGPGQKDTVVTIERAAEAIRDRRAELAVQAKDAERYRACRYAALAASTDPMIDAMRDWPDVTTPEEFDVQADQIVVAMAAQEKAK